jgi:hypothetical protein
MTVETLERWEPPQGMDPEVAKAWRSFYGSIKLKYGMTPRFYRALYLAQSGRCYICQQASGINPDDPKGGGTRRLGVDHNHAIGNRIEAVRGLLCTGGDRTCNRIIGWLDAEQLSRAVSLLGNPPAQRLRFYLAGIPSRDIDDDLITHWLTR